MVNNFLPNPCYYFDHNFFKIDHKVFKLNSLRYFMWYFHFADIDECSSKELNGCQHSCTNNAGSFVCSCNVGYRLDADNRKCNGQCY